MVRFAKDALSYVALCAGFLFVCATVAAGVRVLPWALDPSLPMRVVVPFAKSLIVLAAEAAVVVGWPLGWALFASRLVLRGEARVLATLGEAPQRTVARLRVQAVGLVLGLAALSLLGGRDANAPGYVVQDLLDEGRAACASAKVRETHVVPVVEVSWVCGPGLVPRLVGHPPLVGGGLAFSAEEARVSPDLARFQLDRVHVLTPPVGQGTAVRLQVGQVVLHGLAPFSFASSLPPWLRALVLALATALSAHLAFVGVVSLGPRRRLVVHGAALGAVGPLVVLFSVRFLEARGASLAIYPVAPALAAVATLLVARALSCLPEGAHTGTK